MCIIQQKKNDNSLDQNKYCQSILWCYLDSAGCENIIQPHSTPLPSGFIASGENLSASDDESHNLSMEYKIDFCSCFGSLVYLTLTWMDILFAVNKLVKLASHPGKLHFDALVYVLCYLRDNANWGLQFYHNFSTSPVCRTLSGYNLPTTELFFTMCYSSWNDYVGNNRSTGCFLIFYMGGIIDHSSDLPETVALSSAEEYNQACLAIMATTHANMILEDLTQHPSSSPGNTFMDSKSGITIGSSFKYTKHTRHILRRFHYVRDVFNNNCLQPLFFYFKTTLLLWNLEPHHLS